MENVSSPAINVGIVEDQRRTREGLCALIDGSVGFNCVGAWRSMEEAMTAHPEGGAPQVVLLDIGLPDANGYQLADLIHKDLEFKSVPIIAVTGYDRDEDKSKLVGIDLHLVKPITADDLRSAFSRLGLGN